MRQSAIWYGDVPIVTPSATVSNLSGADSPLNVVTPDFIGQVYVQDDGTIWQAGSLSSSSWTVICTPGDSSNGIQWGPDATTLDSLHLIYDELFGGQEHNVKTLTVSGLETITDEITVESSSDLEGVSFPDLVTVGGDLTIDSNVQEMITASFASLQSVGGGVTINSLANLTSVLFPNLQSVGQDLDLSSDTALTTVDFSSLATVSGQLNLSSCASLVNLSLPVLSDLTGGDTNFSSMTLLQTASLPSLTAAGGLDFPDCDALTSVDLSALVTGTYLNFAPCALLPSLDLSALTTLTGDMTFNDCVALTTFLIPNLVIVNGTTLNFNNCALNAASVALILARCVAAGVTTCTIDLSGGTSAGLLSLSAQGQADYATLFAAGNTITLNA